MQQYLTIDEFKICIIELHSTATGCLTEGVPLACGRPISLPNSPIPVFVQLTLKCTHLYTSSGSSIHAYTILCEKMLLFRSRLNVPPFILSMCPLIQVTESSCLETNHSKLEAFIRHLDMHMSRQGIEEYGPCAGRWGWFNLVLQLGQTLRAKGPVPTVYCSSL